MVAQIASVGVLLAYSGVGRMAAPSELLGKPRQGFDLTTQALADDAWSDAHTAANALSQNNGLKPGKMYAIASVSAYAATGKAWRAKHSSFNGCTPGGLMGTTIGQKKNLTDFEHIHGACPVFSSASPLTIQGYDTGAATPVIHVEVVQLD